MGPQYQRLDSKDGQPKVYSLDEKNDPDGGSTLYGRLPLPRTSIDSSASSGDIDDNLPASLSKDVEDNSNYDVVVGDSLSTTTPNKRGIIGLVTGTSMVISQLIGAGIFSTPSSVLREVGSPGMALLLWGLAALVTIGGGLAFCEMGLMYPQNGGMLRYLAKAYPRPRAYLAFVFSWAANFFIRPAAMSAGGIVFARYFLYAVAGGP